MGVTEAAALLGVSEDWVRRWIDRNEPDAEHPQRVPVGEVRGDQGAAERRWRRPFRDAVLDEARRRGRLPPEGSDTAPPAARA
jgi:hypothetical protein